jgi:hypothetical protein
MRRTIVMGRLEMSVHRANLYYVYILAIRDAITNNITSFHSNSSDRLIIKQKQLQTEPES